jgi:hypothetical protein
MEFSKDSAAVPGVFVVPAGADQVQDDATETKLGEMSLHRILIKFSGFFLAALCSLAFTLRIRTADANLHGNHCISPTGPESGCAGGAERVRMSILPIARLEPLRLASGTAGTTARRDRQKQPHPVSSCVCPRRTLLWHRWKLFPINKPVGPQVKAASPAFRV